MTETVGDIVLECFGGAVLPTGAPVPTANITITLPYYITSRLLPDGGSEILLLIDDPGSGTLTGPGTSLPQKLCASTLGANLGGCIGSIPGVTSLYANVSGSAAFASQCAAANEFGGCTGFGDTPNVFVGTVAGNQVAFTGVPLLAAPANSARLFRIVNIRIAAATSALPRPALVEAAVVMSNAAVNIQTPSVVVGTIVNGLIPSVRDAANSGPLTTSSPGSSLAFQQHVGVPGPAGSAILRFTNNFAFAFGPRLAPTAISTGLGPANNAYAQNIPGTHYDASESRFVLAAMGGVAGLADSGTRLKAVFSGVPSGVDVYVTVTNLAGTNTPLNGSTATYPPSLSNNTLYPPIAFLVSSETTADANGSAPTVTPTTTLNGGTLGLWKVPLTGGSGEAVWEAVQMGPNSDQNLDFGVYFSYAANAPPAGTGTVNLSYASSPGTGGYSASLARFASATLPIPRFADPTAAPANIVTIHGTSTVPALSLWGLALLAILLAGSMTVWWRRMEKAEGA